MTHENSVVLSEYCEKKSIYRETFSGYFKTTRKYGFLPNGATEILIYNNSLNFWVTKEFCNAQGENQEPKVKILKIWNLIYNYYRIDLIKKHFISERESNCVKFYDSKFRFRTGYFENTGLFLTKATRKSCFCAGCNKYIC